MKSNKKQEFLNSLDATDEEIENEIPLILENLWELGSMPEYIIRLMKKYIPAGRSTSVTDFGCGKGAVLIQAALEVEFRGVGIDIVPAFIDAAKKYALQHQVAGRIKFETGDVVTAVHQVRHQDVVIYGYDSEILGNVEESLGLLQHCVKSSGWIILETACTPNAGPTIDGLPREADLNRQIDASGLKTIEKIIWDANRIKEVNAGNNAAIEQRIGELVAKYPEKAGLFTRYMENQREECRQIEHDMICATWLLQKTR